MATMTHMPPLQAPDFRLHGWRRWRREWQLALNGKPVAISVSVLIVFLTIFGYLILRDAQDEWYQQAIEQHDSAMRQERENSRREQFNREMANPVRDDPYKCENYLTESFTTHRKFSPSRNYRRCITHNKMNLVWDG